jgi:hypothetical protein
MNSTGAAILSVGIAIFLVLIILAIAIILTSNKKPKHTTRIFEGTPLKEKTTILSPTITKPNFRDIPPSEIAIISAGFLSSPLNFRVGGFGEIIVGSADGGDLQLIISSSERNKRGTAIRVTNIGEQGDIIAIPSSGVIIEGDPRVSPNETVYFVAIDDNKYVRLVNKTP